MEIKFVICYLISELIILTTSWFESINWESVSNISLQSPIDVTLPISVLLVTSSLTDGNSVPTLPLCILSELMEAVISSGESYYIKWMLWYGTGEKVETFNELLSLRFFLYNWLPLNHVLDYLISCYPSFLLSFDLIKWNECELTPTFEIPNQCLPYRLVDRIPWTQQ